MKNHLDNTIQYSNRRSCNDYFSSHEDCSTCEFHWQWHFCCAEWQVKEKSTQIWIMKPRKSTYHVTLDSHVDADNFITYLIAFLDHMLCVLYQRFLCWFTTYFFMFVISVVFCKNSGNSIGTFRYRALRLFVFSCANLGSLVNCSMIILEPLCSFIHAVWLYEKLLVLL